MLKSTTTTIALELNEDTVFCSAFGYGSSFLKVSVPDLDVLAHFNHRVEATGLPCAAAGQCGDDLGPQSILQSRPGVEAVAVSVVLTELLSVDVEARTCHRRLSEKVEATVRGVRLHHSAQDGSATPVSFEACALLVRGATLQPSWGG